MKDKLIYQHSKNRQAILMHVAKLNVGPLTLEIKLQSQEMK